MSLLRKKESGFTLIEVIVSISIFALITVGITPLLISSVRGSGLSRSYTIAKNIGSDAMEGARGLPYYIQNTQATNPQRKDLLDMYFPDLTTSGTAGYQPSIILSAPNAGITLTNVYRTVCGASSSNPACPLSPGASFPRATELPPGYTLEFYAQFAKASPGTASASETYSIEAPSAGYRWTATDGADLPPTGLLRLTVRVAWTYLGAPRSFLLTSLVGERKLVGIKVQGSGQVAYTAKVLTSYIDGSGERTDLNAVRGTSTSSILTRQLAGSTQENSAGRVTLTRIPSVAVPSPSPIAPLVGAEVFAKSPPSAEVANVPVGEGFLTHPDLVGAPQIAFISPSTTKDVSLSVENGLPSSDGGWSYSHNDESQQGPLVSDRVQLTRTFWVTNQADALPGSFMHFTDDPMFTMFPQGSGSGSTGGTGSTSATTTQLDASRKVETTAAVTFRNLCLLPVDFIAGGCVIKVSNFSASVNCKATTTLTGANAARAIGSYSFDLSYWEDPVNNSSTLDGRYVTVPISVSQAATAADLLGPIKVSNPLVYDSLNPLLDVHLFPKLTGQRGYLTDWSMLRTIPVQIASGGRSTGVQLNGALQITTSPTNPAVEQTGMNISLGSLNCSAVDNR